MKSVSRYDLVRRPAFSMALILALISFAIYTYLPRRFERQAVDELSQRATAIADVAGYSLSPVLRFHDRVAAVTALTPLRRNPDVLFFVVRDVEGIFDSFGDEARKAAGPFGPDTRKPAATPGHESETVGAFSDDGRIYRTTTPIWFRGNKIGSLIVGFSLDRPLAAAQRSKKTAARASLIVFALGLVAFLSLLLPITRGVQTGEAIPGSLEALSQAEDELRRSEERYRMLFERNLAGVYIASIDGKVISCNDACARLFGFEFAEEFIEQAGRIMYANEEQRASLHRRLELNGAVFNEEVELHDRSGQSVWALENARLVPGNDRLEPTLEGILLDINDRKRAEEQITYRAFHDELTGLPNGPLFADRVAVALANAQRKGLRVAAMFLDLDDLKTVNDTLGHATGDALLKLVAARLTETLREGDTIARVGGDEFVVLLPEVDQETDALRAALKILHILEKPFLLETDEVHVTTSIGLALSPRDGETAEVLIRNADSAMYRAKQSGGNRVELYRRVGPAILGRSAQEEELRHAIERDEFTLLFQPQVTIKGRQLVGVEALVRWKHPERGMIDPAGFISVAERTGLITVLGEIILRKACEQGMRWQSSGLDVPRIAVNVSPRQLYQHNFVGMVERVLSTTGFDPSLLEMELTENIAVNKGERSRSILDRLRDMKIAIAIDDFGTGQSSLTYLKQFPVDTVKIDRSFVVGVSRKHSDQSIVSAVLLVAKQLGLRTVAEGVETEEQVEFLREHGCHEVQGFLISEPLAPEVLEQRFLRSEAEAV